VTDLPEGLHGRILAWGLGAAALMVVYLAIVQPTVGFYERERRLLDERSMLAARMADAAHRLPALREAVRQAGRGGEGENLFLTGASDTIAVAALQTLLKSLAERTGAKLSNVEILPPEAAGKFNRVAIRTSFAVELHTAVALLKGVETSRPALFVDRLEVRALDKAKPDPARPVLSVTIDVYGLRAPQ
jgi:hypothetical protein